MSKFKPLTTNTHLVQEYKGACPSCGYPMKMAILDDDDFFDWKKAYDEREKYYEPLVSGLREMRLFMRKMGDDCPIALRTKMELLDL